MENYSILLMQFLNVFNDACVDILTREVYYENFIMMWKVLFVWNINFDCVYCREEFFAFWKGIVIKNKICFGNYVTEISIRLDLSLESFF